MGLLWTREHVHETWSHGARTPIRITIRTRITRRNFAFFRILRRSTRHCCASQLASALCVLDSAISRFSLAPESSRAAL